MLTLPKYLIIDISLTMIPLEQMCKDTRYPTIDADSVLSCMFEALEKPNLTGKPLDDAVAWMLQAHGLTSVHLHQKVRAKASGLFYLCFLLLRHELTAINPYHNGRLHYYYKMRHGQKNVILERYNA